MPRYFIDAAIGPRRYQDYEGCVLRDDLSAHDMAVLALYDLARAAVTGGGELPVSASVRSDTGACLCTVNLAITTEWRSDRADAPASRCLSVVEA